MNIIRVELLPDFMWGDDVVLLAMDGAGVGTFADALNDAVRLGSSRLEHGGVTHEFVMQVGAADIELGEALVVWRLDRTKAIEIVDDLTAIKEADGPGHNYVDIATPTNTLVLSRDEYVRVVPRHGRRRTT
jgi:hypothetical protein